MVGSGVVFNDNEAGFSLLEILVAVALLGIAMSTAFVNINGMIKRSELKAFKDSVTLLVQDARYASISQQRDISLVEHVESFFSSDVPTFYLDSDVVVRRSGVCSEGKIVANQKDHRLVYSIINLGCDMRLEQS